MTLSRPFSGRYIPFSPISPKKTFTALKSAVDKMRFKVNEGKTIYLISNIKKKWNTYTNRIACHLLFQQPQVFSRLHSPSYMDKTKNSLMNCLGFHSWRCCCFLISEHLVVVRLWVIKVFYIHLKLDTITSLPSGFLLFLLKQLLCLWIFITTRCKWVRILDKTSGLARVCSATEDFSHWRRQQCLLCSSFLMLMEYLVVPI